MLASPVSFDFDYLRRIVREKTAIVLEAEKVYLAEAKLGPIVRRSGSPSLTDLLRDLRNRPWGATHQQVVEAMTNNETSFFRDLYPYEALKNRMLPELLAKRAHVRELNIWSAASSSGQEAASIAMVIRENFRALDSWKIRILGTDIAAEMVNRCKEGLFAQHEVNRGLPAQYLVKYFDRVGLHWRLKPILSEMMEFRQMNLSALWPNLPTMDIVFLRNVLIYFDVDTKRTILTRMKSLLRPDSYLLLGGAETTLNIVDDYERVDFSKFDAYRLKNRSGKV